MFQVMESACIHGHKEALLDTILLFRYVQKMDVYRMDSTVGHFDNTT